LTLCKTEKKQIYITAKNISLQKRKKPINIGKNGEKALKELNKKIKTIFINVL
jgi:hypothetical protein